MKLLQLMCCNFCVHLPPIRQLTNLKYLRIVGAKTVFKYMEAVAFPRLETLIIEDVPNRKKWNFVEDVATAAATEGGEDGGAEMRKGSPVSKDVAAATIVGFPKLRALPRQLGQEATNLKVLIIQGASCLKAVVLERVSNLPQVRELRVSRCPNLRCVEELWFAAVVAGRGYVKDLFALGSTATRAASAPR